MRLPLPSLSLCVLLFGLSWPLCGQSGNAPPSISAQGDQYYCPLTSIAVVTEFEISDPDDDTLDEFYVQISTGYVRGEDRLFLSEEQENVVATWNPQTGKLTLSGRNNAPVSLADMSKAVRAVSFTSNSPLVSGERYFSLTAGDANFLPSTGHYYEYVPSIGITWTQARDLAEQRTYNGLPGYLATVTKPEEAQLTGEQAEGAGWIGGSDAQTEGEWKWVTGPEAGTVFWIGLADGYAPAGAFEFWNTGEPNNLNDEDYAHVTAPGIGIPGSWNDLRNTGESSGDYQPKGYIVEYGYGGPEDATEFSASTRVYTTVVESISPGYSCGPGQVVLSAVSSEIGNLPEPLPLQWFDSETATTPVFIGTDFTTPVLLATRDYFVLSAPEGCVEGIRERVSASVFEVPAIAKEITLRNCDQDGIPNDGFTDFNLEEATEWITAGDESLSTSYHLTLDQAEEGTDPLAPFPFNNRDASWVYARVENPMGCFDTSEVSLEVSATLPLNAVLLESCDTDTVNEGKTVFDLTQASVKILEQLPPQNLSVQYFRNLDDAVLEQNEILPQDSYQNEEAYYQSLYVRIESLDNGDCISLGEFAELYVYPLPEFSLSQEQAVFCLGEAPVRVEIADPAAHYSYQWSDDAGTVISIADFADIQEAGNYKVVATSAENCVSLPRTLKVIESSVADLGPEDVVVEDGGDYNSIRVLEEDLGIGSYEYSLDNALGPFQSEPYFEDVPPGVHVLYARDMNGCGLASTEVYLIGYPKFFTPNGDGINDTWQVKGVVSQPGSLIYIFDKFGKLLQKIEPYGPGWDGVYKGKEMPSTDYWYRVELEDGRVHTGHFSLIRR